MRFWISYFLVQISFFGISIVLVLSIIYTTFCICSLIYFINMIHITLNQLKKCIYNGYEHICSCYGPNKRNWNSLFLLKLHITGKKNSPLWRTSVLRFITLSHIGLDMFSNNFLNNSYVYFIWQFFMQPLWHQLRKKSTLLLQRDQNSRNDTYR